MARSCAAADSPCLTTPSTSPTAERTRPWAVPSWPVASAMEALAEAAPRLSALVDSTSAVDVSALKPAEDFCSSARIPSASPREESTDPRVSSTEPTRVFSSATTGRAPLMLCFIVATRPWAASRSAAIWPKLPEALPRTSSALSRDANPVLRSSVAAASPTFFLKASATAVSTAEAPASVIEGATPLLFSLT